MLRIHPGGRVLADETGKTVWLMGDTAWELFHRLDREEALRYLDCRAEQGFNFIQCVILAELNGLTEPNAYGRLPLLTGENGMPDPMRPDTSGPYSYFDHAEFIVSAAEERGLTMGILPTWGDKFNRLWGAGPEIFTPENARAFGKWLGRLLARHENIVWILGGDRPLTDPAHFAVEDALAAGLREGDGGRFLMTFHPSGNASSADYVHDRPWLDFNMIQSGHGLPTDLSHIMIARDRERTPVKPVMDGEQRYEDHPKNFDPKNGYYDAADVRVTMWRNLFAGAAGDTYGHHAVWSMRRSAERYFPGTWEDALRRPGAESVRVISSFVKSHDPALFEPVTDAVENNEEGANYVAAVLVPSEKRAHLLIPCGIPERLNPARFPKPIARITAFSPADGSPVDVRLDENGRILFPGRCGGHGQEAVVTAEWD